ncbi:ligand-binding sensor domain-containing diguanylate cyclase [Lacimicrobium alkaliphilum]|uniref:diguanylate cyclase n=1 Tax=Lacimicrobium alkaliphilum TaxID=1526571 RepID=A0ABQ1R5S9_9ALTE|nr:ligand-binding sensor domain-containing diguanylate cyclase [Lacimicrobium alkaliphilum]GGD59084.1 GGDEF domain-containing protein [Lacimicrobium alkaliphilum]
MRVKAEVEYSRIACGVFFLFAVLLLIPQMTYAQGKLTDFFQESWTTRDGLPHNTINSIQQTEDGYLWFATWEGVARFNGRSMEVFGRGEKTGLPDTGTYNLGKDCQGNLLVTSARGGLSKVRPERWVAEPAFSSMVRALHCDAAGDLWLGTDNAGVIRQQPDGTRTRFSAAQGLTDERVYDLVSDKDGAIWVGTAGGLFRIVSEQAQAVDNDKRFSGLPDGPVFSVKVDLKDRLLIGTENGVYRLENQRFTRLDSRLDDVAALELLVGQNGALWIGTVENGLFRIHNGELEHLSAQEGLPNNRITSLFIDREGSLWLGTNGGLFRLRDAPFSTLTDEKGLTDNFVRALLQARDGSIYIGTSRGLDVIQGDQLKALNGKVVSSSVLSLAQAPDNAIWVGSYTQGLARWHEGKVQQAFTRDSGLFSNEVRAILPVDDTRLWVGTVNGLNIIQNRLVTALPQQNELPSPFISSLLSAPDGRIWIGTAKGLAYWKDNQLEVLDLGPHEQAEFIFGFYQQPDNQALWAASDRGLLRYDYASESLGLVGVSAGMPFDKYFQIVADEQGFFWVSSNRGIIRINSEHATQVALGERTSLDYELFGESDGMVSSQANGGSNPAAIKTHDGDIWIATAKGVARVQPERLSEFSAIVPPAVIESLVADGKPYQPANLPLLPAGTNRIEIRYAGLGFVMPSKIQYRTLLEGFDNDWVSRNTQTSSEFTNLPPGEYEFKVMASYPDGEWSQQESVRFSIQPFFWQRTSFWVLVIALVLLLVSGLIKWRLVSLQRAANTLKLKVDEQTAELREKAESLQRADIEKSALVEKIRQQSEAFELQARQDALTGLGNRRAFDEAITRELSRARRHESPLCLILLDLDFFKRVNDQFSHAIGDKVLTLVAQSIRENSREIDTLARWGGEEFALLLPNTCLEDALALAERLRQSISQLDCRLLLGDFSLTGSLGLAEAKEGENAEALLHRADNALYRAKEEGRNRVCVATTDNR